ncbi:PQQ-dependent sugar dehydrogenase [Streptomyces sp. NBC_00562]|uniref:PQQ-dependent sugar dehydrogenase n=1 Tax=Streptomyces sp. NBC_00562 TaxID=2975777 RepID=UPI002E803C20|nr:PQQ-dependent sugar dehydrogenase [Streptomyces sp. NBC_00562]WUC23451.1 PQQ-dependent sugar dehydrogenase [Streptomyces sp. NBC_00562]
MASRRTYRRPWAAVAVSAALALGGLAAPSHADEPAAATAALTDPIPQKPVQSRTGLVLQEFAQFPKSEPVPAPTDPRLMRHARINTINELPDGSGRMATPDLNGTLYLTDPGTATRTSGGTPHPYLDVKAAFPHFFSGRGLGQGFGYAAFHPEFGANGRFYTIHTELASQATETPDYRQAGTLTYHGIITEWTADDPSAAVFHGTHREVLRIGFTGQVHGIQQIDFNPTAKPHDEDYGLLYLAVGDGGQGVGNSEPQNLTLPHGKLLRIDPAGRDSANGRYGVPASNPFIGEPGALGEIYAIGMRDPHRFSWDAGGSHRMYLGHIGEHAIESVYEVKAGDNFGWSEREGPFVFDKKATDPCARILPLPADDAQYGYIYPVAAYDHDPGPDWNCRSDVGRAIAGGSVYRGKDAPALRGKYIFGDLVDGRILAADTGDMHRGGELAPLEQLMLFDKSTGKAVTMRDLAGDQRVDLRFGSDRSGGLYIVSKANGKVWKVTGTRTFADCEVGNTPTTHTTGPDNWAPVTPAKWAYTTRETIMTEPGVARPGPRRPFEYAVLTAGPRYSSVTVEAEVRIDTPVEITNRDVILIWDYQSDTRFQYAHLSSDNTIYPHNGLFTVNDADRLRIDDQWNGTYGAPPAIKDDGWHKVRLTHCADTGETAVYLDGSRNPLITATDPVFASGRVGFGSFDNAGRVRHLKVKGTRAGD